jgi:hypothetical protein
LHHFVWARVLFVSSRATTIPETGICASAVRLLNAANLASGVRTADVKQFASVLQPCPTTSRPRDIPAGNIRQQQNGFHLTFSSRKSPSLRMGKWDVSEELPRTSRRADMLRQQALRRRPGLNHAYAEQPPKRNHRAPRLRLCACGATESHLPTNRPPRKILTRSVAPKGTIYGSGRHVRLLFLPGISRGREVVGHVE